MIDISTYLTLVETESKKDKLETIYNEYLSVMTYVARDLVGKYNAAEDVVFQFIKHRFEALGSPLGHCHLTVDIYA